MQPLSEPPLTTFARAVQNQDRLMEQLMQLDMSQNNILTVQALAQAAEAGKANLKANDLENVEEVLDDIADQNSQMAQMQDALAMPTGMMAEMDGDELDDELAVRTHLLISAISRPENSTIGSRTSWYLVAVARAYDRVLQLRWSARGGGGGLVYVG